MIIANRITGIPKQFEPGLASPDRGAMQDSFFMILDKSLKASMTLHGSPGTCNSGKTNVNQRESQPLQKNGSDNRLNDVQHRAIERTEPRSSYRQDTAHDRQEMTDEDIAKRKTARFLSNQYRLGAKTVEDVTEDQPLGKRDDMDLIHECEKLQNVLDQIYAALQQFIESAEMMDVADENNEGVGLPTLSMKSLVQEMENGIAQLLQSAENLEGTKTSAYALQFANKLQKLLAEGGLGQFLQDDVKLRVEHISDAQKLVQKMIHETQNTKMHIVTESVTEITIPTVNSRATEQSSGVGTTDDSAGTDADIPKNRVQSPTSLSNQPSSGQMDQQDSGEKKGLEMQLASGTWEEAVADISNEPGAEQAAMGAFDQVQAKWFDNTGIPKAHSITKPEIVEQIIEKAETLLEGDKSEMVMQLRPESLGKITLRIIHERGEITAGFMAENEQVKAILEGNMQLLKDALQKSGVAVQNLSVSVGQQEQGGREQSSQPGYGERPAVRRMTLNSPEPDTVQPVYQHSGFAGTAYLNESSEINLTA